MRLHISIGGTANGDLEDIRNLESDDNEFDWTVPSGAEIGDMIFLIVPYISGPIRARGTVMSELEWTEDFGGRYRAIIQVERLKIPVELTDLQNAFPTIPYLKNPKIPYTVLQRDAVALIKFVEQYQHEKADIWRMEEQLAVRSQEVLADSIIVPDERVRVAASIVLRRGQQFFRNQLLNAYEECCAISNVGLKDVLEAAHIRSYSGKMSNQISNGLLLRADLHTLFDLNLLSINPDDLSIVLAPRVAEIPVYSYLTTKKLRLPKREEFYPNRVALSEHFAKLRVNAMPSTKSTS